MVIQLIIVIRICYFDTNPTLILSNLYSAFNSHNQSLSNNLTNFHKSYSSIPEACHSYFICNSSLKWFLAFDFYPSSFGCYLLRLSIPKVVCGIRTLIFRCTDGRSTIKLQTTFCDVSVGFEPTSSESKSGMLTIAPADCLLARWGSNSLPPG